MFGGARVTLIVGGSIAAYKAAEIVRELVKGNARVRVVLTRAAQEFITPMTMQTLSQNAVATDMLDAGEEAEIGHISLADEADAIVVAPATANLIAKAAAGIADDLATTVLLATRAPVLIAPAMNVNMWRHPATEENVAVLKSRGVHFVEPEEGELACGWLGAGRLAAVEAVSEHLIRILTKDDLAGSHVVVTAGPTRESLDPIRFFTNHSSGKMGYAIARNAARRGARVSLVSGPTLLSPPSGVDFFSVQTAQEMREQVIQLVGATQEVDGERCSTQFVFMVAAVADYRPEQFSDTKIKRDKTQPFSVNMVPNPDILLELGNSREKLVKSSGCDLKLIGFAAETGEVEDMLISARGKLENKKVDMIVGNFAKDSFGKDTTRVWIIDRHGREEEISTADKNSVAARIVSMALKS